MPNNATRAAGSGEPAVSNNRPRRTMPAEITDVYVYAGHGNQIPDETFEERPIVPPGKIIVFFPEHAKPFETIAFDNVWASMATQPTLYQNPFANFDAIKQVGGTNTVRIYLPGQKVPSILYSPYANSISFMGEEKIFPSGCYEVKPSQNKPPTPALPLVEKNGLKESPKYKSNNSTSEIYSGEANVKFFYNCFNIEDVHRVPLNEVKPKKISTGDLLQCLPNGIHYFLSCRMIEGLAAKIRIGITDYKAGIAAAIERLETIQASGRGLESLSFGELANEILSFVPSAPGAAPAPAPSSTVSEFSPNLSTFDPFTVGNEGVLANLSRINRISSSTNTHTTSRRNNNIVPTANNSSSSEIINNSHILNQLQSESILSPFFDEPKLQAIAIEKGFSTDGTFNVADILDCLRTMSHILEWGTKPRHEGGEDKQGEDLVNYVEEQITPIIEGERGMREPRETQKALYDSFLLNLLFETTHLKPVRIMRTKSTAQQRAGKRTRKVSRKNRKSRKLKSRK